MNQNLEKLTKILQKGSIAQTQIKAGSITVMNASIPEIPQMMNLIKTTLLKFLEDNVPDKKILSLFYICNDLFFQAKNQNNRIIQPEFEKIFPQMIDGIAIKQFKDTHSDILKSLLKVLNIWQEHNLIRKNNLKKLISIISEKLAAIEKKNQLKAKFTFPVEDLIILSERINKKKEWKQNKNSIKKKIQKLEQQQDTQEEQNRNLAHLRKCNDTLNEIDKKISTAKRDVCNNIKINIKKLMIDMSDFDKEIKNLQGQINLLQF